MSVTNALVKTHPLMTLALSGSRRGCSEFSSHWDSEGFEDDPDGYECFDNAQVDSETLKQLLRNLAPTVNTPLSFLFGKLTNSSIDPDTFLTYHGRII